jgi:hypothetical protein
MGCVFVPLSLYENGAGTPPGLSRWMKAPLAKPDHMG